MQALSRNASPWLLIGAIFLCGLAFLLTAARPQKPQPPTDDPSSLVQLSATLNAQYYLSPVEHPIAYMYLEVKTGDYQPQEQRTPLNLSLVIDRSGSMHGEKLVYAKKAAVFVAENLSKDDYISVVTYDDTMLTNWGSAKAHNQQELLNVINRIAAGGSTNLSGGLFEGYQQAQSTFNSQYTNRVLLLSDGLANKGITAPERLAQIASEKNEKWGITLSTFGVGANYNEDLMQNLAEHGSGNYYFIENPDQIPQLFEREMNGLLSVVAQNSTLSFTLPKGVTVEKVYGYLHDQSGNEVSIRFRDLVANGTKAVLVKLRYPNQASAPLTLPVKLAYTDATGTYLDKELTTQVELQFTNDAKVAAASHRPEIEQWVSFYESNELLEKAMEAVDQRKYEQAEQLLFQNSSYLHQRKKSYGSNTYLWKQDSVSTLYQNQVKNADSLSSQEYKVMQKSGKSLNYELRKRK